MITTITCCSRSSVEWSCDIYDYEYNFNHYSQSYVVVFDTFEQGVWNEVIESLIRKLNAAGFNNEGFEDDLITLFIGTFEETLWRIPYLNVA